MKKFFKRKFLLSLILFIVACIFKWYTKIGDVAWLVAMIAAVWGYQAANSFLKAWFHLYEDDDNADS